MESTSKSKFRSGKIKTEQEREKLIEAINVLLNQSYDDTLDEIYALLQKIEDHEDEAGLRNHEYSMNNYDLNDTIAWDEIKNEIANERKKVKIFKSLTNP